MKIILNIIFLLLLGCESKLNEKKIMESHYKGFLEGNKYVELDKRVSLDTIMKYVNDERIIPTLYAMVSIDETGKRQTVKEHDFGLYVRRSLVCSYLLDFAVVGRMKTQYMFDDWISTMDPEEMLSWYKENQNLHLRDFRILVLEKSQHDKNSHNDGGFKFRSYLLDKLKNGKDKGPQLKDLNLINQLESITFEDWKNRYAEQANGE